MLEPPASSALQLGHSRSGGLGALFLESCLFLYIFLAVGFFKVHLELFGLFSCVAPVRIGSRCFRQVEVQPRARSLELPSLFFVIIILQLETAEGLNDRRKWPAIGNHGFVS